jgi:hypothetical protein
MTTAREKREQEIAFSDEPLITRMMQVLEYRWYVDTDWRSETTFEEDVRPLFEKMIANLPPQNKVDSCVEKELYVNQYWDVTTNKTYTDDYGRVRYNDSLDMYYWASPSK